MKAEKEEGRKRGDIEGKKGGRKCKGGGGEGNEEEWEVEKEWRR